jgi:hypothetical protein
MFQTVSKPIKYITGWWFGTFFIFPYIGNNHPNWLSYFSKGLKPPTRLNILDPMNWFVTSSSTQKFSPSELCVNSLAISWWGLSLVHP